MATNALFRTTVGRRLLGALAAVLVLFGAALAVELVTLRLIAEAEAEVERFDHAKHAGHMAAAQVREQYIHQAHTLIEFDKGHLDHYEKVVLVTRDAIKHLEEVAPVQDKSFAVQIALLAEENDRDFHALVIPALERGDRGAVAALGDRLETVVDRVVILNTELNESLDARARSAREHAEQLRDRSVIWTVACFALAIVLAAGLGAWLTRSMVRRVERLRDGTRRLGTGDLTTRIELDGHDEFSELAAAFNQMAARLASEQAALIRSQKLASIGHVAAGVAHELNNPLLVILGYSKLLRVEAGSSSEELRIIEDEARQCQRIVQGLLDLARPHQLEVESVDLTELVREAVERMQGAGALDDREVTLLSHAPVFVSADAGSLRQVIANVLTNATEATPPSGKITIETRVDSDHSTLTVTDDGPGVAPEILQNVFDPFVTTKPRGTGLGLSIAQAIVDAHGGTISISSSPSSGTLVLLQLPSAVAPELPAS